MLRKKLSVLFFLLLMFCVLAGIVLYRQIFVVTGEKNEKVFFEVPAGESVSTLSTRLKDAEIIQSVDLFKLYLKYSGLDKNIQSGSFELVPPFTIASVAKKFGSPQIQEKTITLIPGWDLNDFADYFKKESMASTSQFFALTGTPAQFGPWASSTFAEYSLLAGKPQNVSLEGYLAPDTYRIFQDESIESILKRLLAEREEQFTPAMLEEINRQGKTVHEILTMASVIEREVKGDLDRKKVSDLFWRRVDAGWGLQADSTVHYLVEREGDVFTRAHEREIDSLYNTYKYKGLPPGPISSPSLSSIQAAMYPEKNDAWYFLTTFEGEVKYGRTLDEHNANVQKYLR